MPLVRELSAVEVERAHDALERGTTEPALLGGMRHVATVLLERTLDEKTMDALKPAATK